MSAPAITVITPTLDDIEPCGPIFLLEPADPGRGRGSAATAEHIASQLVRAFHSLDQWDMPQQVFGLLSTSRLGNDLSDMSRTLLLELGATTKDGWMAVPIDRSEQVNRSGHFVDILVGLRLYGWDGIALLTEAWMLPFDAPLSTEDQSQSRPMSEDPRSVETRQVMVVMSDSVQPLATVAQLLRTQGPGDDAQIVTAGQWLPVLLHAAVNGPLPARLPFSFLHRIIGVVFLFDPSKLPWAFDLTLSEPVAHRAGVDYFTSDVANYDTISANRNTPTPPLTWNEYVSSMDRLGCQPLPITPATREWFGNQIALDGVNDPPDKTERVTELASLAWCHLELRTPTLRPAQDLDQALAVVRRVVLDLPTDPHLLDLLARAALGQAAPGKVPDDLAQLEQSGLLTDPKRIFRWTAAHPDPRVRRVNFARLRSMVDPADLAAVLTDLLTLPTPLAAKIVKRFDALCLATTYSDPTAADAPAPVRRLAAVLADSPV